MYLSPCHVSCPCLHVYVSVSKSPCPWPCHHVFLSMFPCACLVFMSLCPYLHVHVSMSLLFNIFMSHVYVSMFPCLQVSGIPQSVVGCKRKTETANFRLFAANDRQTIDGNRRLFSHPLTCLLSSHLPSNQFDRQISKCCMLVCLFAPGPLTVMDMSL